MTLTTYTKRDVAMMALEEIALANYVFDGTAEEDTAALRRLDALMASPPWIAVAYSQPLVAGQSSPSDLIGIDDRYLEAVYTNLASRIAPTYGKTVSPETRAAAVRGMSAVSAAYALANLQQITRSPQTPRGAGNRRWQGWGSPFYPGIAQPETTLSILTLSTDTVSLSA